MVGDHRLAAEQLAGALGALLGLGEQRVQRRAGREVLGLGPHRAERGEGGARVGVVRRRATGGRARQERRLRRLAEALVPGVPTAVSAGGAGGLPDLPREARGRGVESVAGLRAMRDIWREAGTGATDQANLRTPQRG